MSAWAADPARDPRSAPAARIPAQPSLKPVAIVGPTASGKTEVAIELARRTGGEILSFDSRQVYQGIPVSSNAPPAEDLGAVPLHLVGLLDPSEELTAARYVQMARATMSAVAPDRHVVLTAGTGMYLKAFLENLDLGGMGAVPELRETLEAEAERDLPGLARRLAELSPELASLTDLQNPVRVVRRMELLVAAAFAEDAHDPGADPRADRIDAVRIGLSVPVTVLQERIEARIEQMLNSGWREEVAALLDRRPAPCQQVLNSIGVAEMAAHLRGDLTEAALREKVLVRTRQYAKRQRTWFRGDPEVRWLEAGNRSASDIVGIILEMVN